MRDRANVLPVALPPSFEIDPVQGLMPQHPDYLKNSYIFSKVIARFFITDTKVSSIVFRTSETYLVTLDSNKNNPFGGKIPILACHFTTRFFASSCKPTGKHAGEYCYRIIGQKLGKGHFGTVFALEGKVRPDEKGFYLFSAGKKNKVVKLIAATKETKKYIINEGKFAALIPEIAAKPIQTVLKECVLYYAIVMNNLASPTSSESRYLLQKIIEQDSYNKILSPVERISILLAIAENIYMLHKIYRILHLDIKPENIFIEGGSDDKAISFDFGLSMENNEKAVPAFGLGSSIYMAPEMYTDENIPTPKNDFYALARIGGHLFGSYEDHMNTKYEEYVAQHGQSDTDLRASFCHDYDNAADLEGSMHFEDLFKDIDTLSDTNKEKVKALLEHLGKIDPEKRLADKKAIKAIKKVQRSIFVEARSQMRRDLNDFESQIATKPDEKAIIQRDIVAKMKNEFSGRVSNFTPAEFDEMGRGELSNVFCKNGGYRVFMFFHDENVRHGNKKVQAVSSTVSQKKR